MPATIIIQRPVFVNNDVLEADDANAVWINSGTVPDATPEAFGVIKLAGDLAGTAEAPVIGAHKVTLAKLQQIATDMLLGRATAEDGAVELIPCVAVGRDLLANATPAGAALVKAADLAAQRALLMTVAGIALAAAADVAAQRTALGINLVPNLDWREAATLKQVAETPVAVAIVAGVATIDLALGTVFVLPLTENVTSFTVSNPVADRVNVCSFWITQHATAAKTVTWTFTGRTIRGTPATMTATLGKLDIITFVSVDGGATWVPFGGGQGF